MRKILVPCDFSEASVQAFRFAADVARKSNGEIHLLHAVELPVLYDSSAVLTFEEQYLQDMKKNAEANFRKMQDKWASDGVKIKTYVEFGGLQTVIKRIIDGAKIDLVIAGTHGASGLKEFTIGSNAEKLVRTSPVPVIAVRKAPKLVNAIVFPTDPDLNQEDLTMKVKDLQNFFKATLHVLYVNTPAKFKSDVQTKKSLADFARRFMLKNCTLNIYNDLTEEMGIINFTRETKAELVAMRTHGRRGLAHFASGSIAEDVVNHLDCLIWTYKIK